MGFWEKLFGKKKSKIEETDGQEQYFKDEYKTVDKKIEKKAEVKKPVADEKKSEPASKAVKEKAPAPKTQKAATSAKKPAESKAKSTVKAEKPKAATAKPKAKSENTKAATAKPKASAEINDDSPEVKGSATVQESKATANGKFDIRKAKDGRFFFSLYSSNGAVIAYSQIYSSVSAVNTGINSVITNATKAEIEDTTLKKPVSLPCPKWEIYIDKAEQYRFRLYATNGLCVCHSSHGYATKSGCKGGIDSIRRFAAEARVDKSYLK